MEKERLRYLLNKHFSRETSPAEQLELLGYVTTNEASAEAYVADFIEQHPPDVRIAAAELEPLIQGVISIDKETKRVHFRRTWTWAAASILLMLAIGAYIFKDTSSAPPAVSAQEILPGKSGAILTLADGSQVSLDSIQNGVVALQGGAKVKVENGSLVYEAGSGKAVYNRMSTPKGRQFHLTLPDGTEVWLNNASSIRYPTVFTGGERKVEVTGEAYFKVAKNKGMPFRLNVSQQAEVVVLGTEFNVNAYDNENSISTTLIEGSVLVQGVMLKPGQQAQLSYATQSIEVISDINIEKVIAWKNGVFNFNNISFDAAMRQLERWYDIEVVYEKDVPENIELYGEITKGVTLNGLINVLKDIGIECRLEGRKLVIES